MTVKKILATLPLVLNACAGDDEVTYTPNEPGQGIWEGAISAEAISTTTSASGAVSTFESTSATGLGIYSSFIRRNNIDYGYRAFFYKEDDGTLFTNDAPGVANNNLIFAPDIYRNGSLGGSVIFEGNPYISTSIEGNYRDSAQGNYVMLFDQAYFRGGDLARLTGAWNYTTTPVNGIGNWQLEVDADGSFVITSTLIPSCSGIGAFYIIGDGSKNEYDVSILLNGCGATYNASYQGLAATIDTVSQNDTISMAFYNNEHGFYIKPIKN